MPWLRNACRAVAPTVGTVADDTDHGSAYLGVRTPEMPRDRAAVAADYAELAARADRRLGATIEDY